LAHATIRRRVASIAKLHRAARIEDPTKTEEVRNALKATARALGTTQRAAPALRLRDVDRIVDAVGRDARRKRRTEPGQLLLRERRDLAMLRVGYALLARANELASITVEAITWQEDGTALVDLLRRKTSTESKPTFLNLEAATALREWITAAGITSGHVFTALGKGGVPTGVPLSRCSISRSLKRRARTAGLTEEVSSHSLRRGMTQDLMVAGADIMSVAKAGGWKSPMMPLRYAEGVAANDGAVAQFFRKLGR
jgi:integrase